MTACIFFPLEHHYYRSNPTIQPIPELRSVAVLTRGAWVA